MEAWQPTQTFFRMCPSFFFFVRKYLTFPRVRLNLDRHALDHFQPIAFDADDLARIIGDQLDLMQAEIHENLRADAVIPQVGLEAELADSPRPCRCP